MQQLLSLATGRILTLTGIHFFACSVALFPFCLSLSISLLFPALYFLSLSFLTNGDGIQQWTNWARPPYLLSNELLSFLFESINRSKGCSKCTCQGTKSRTRLLCDSTFTWTFSFISTCVCVLCVCVLYSAGNLYPASLRGFSFTSEHTDWRVHVLSLSLFAFLPSAGSSTTFRWKSTRDRLSQKASHEQRTLKLPWILSYFESWICITTEIITSK